MEQDSPGRPQRLHDEDVNVDGARNISKLEKLETQRTQTTTSRSVTTNGHQGSGQYMNGDDSMSPSSSPEILVDDALRQRKTFAIADKSDDWRSKMTEQHADVVEQRSGRQVQRYDAEKRRSAAGEQRFDTKEQEHSTRSLSRHERNAAAAQMAYRVVGLPADMEYGQVSKRSKVISTGGRSKPRGGLSGLRETTDLIVEDAMEEAIEAMYGKKRRRKIFRDVKTSSAGETRSLDRHARMTTTVDRRANSGYDTMLTENNALGQTITDTTSRDDSRKKAVSSLRVEKYDEDVEQDFDLRRPASANGRLTNRVDYMANRRAHRLPRTAPSRPRYQATYTSPLMSRYQPRTATNVLASQGVSGYSSETELMQSSRRPDRRQHFSGDDSDFSTTVEIRNPRSTQFQTENGGYTSDESETRNLQYTSSQSRVPTLTKGMVTKILHGERPQSKTTEMFVSEVRLPDTQSVASPVQFTASPPSSINVFSSPAVYRDSQLSAVVPVGTAIESRSTYRPYAVDDNFLLQRAPAYQTRIDAAHFVRQTAMYGSGGRGRSTPTNLQAMVENDERPSSSYAAFSNEPIIVANLDDDYTTKMTSMRRAHSLFALDEMSPASAAIGRSQTPIYSPRPDISMTNRQVLNLYLFNRRVPGDGKTELETLTRTMTFDEEVQRINTGNKQTQTTTLPPVRREKTHYITRQRDVEKLTSPTTKQRNKYIQTDSEEHVPPKPAERRKPKPSRVTEETVIVKPSITETRETEMVGDVFADRRQILSEEPETPAVLTTRSLVSALKEPVQEESEEETLETTVVEEKEQRIEMTIREDLEFSLQRSRGTATAVTGSTDDGRIEPWWIPDKFEAFVERKRQKITQTKDTENKDDHSKRIDIEDSARKDSARSSPETYDASKSNNFENNYSNFESNFDNQTTSQNQRETTRNVRIPIFLQNRYQSPLHGMTSPSANLVRTKMTTHSEPELNRRRQYYMAKRDKYYGSLFDDSHHKPLITDNYNNDNSLVVTSSHMASSADVPELRLEVVDNDKASDDSNSATQEPLSTRRRYVSSYSHYISPPVSSGEYMVSTTGNHGLIASRSDTGTGARHQPVTSWTDAVFPTSNIIGLPDVEPNSDYSETRGDDNDQLPESLDHFDRVLTEIEEDLPPPPLPPPLPPGNQQARTTSSQASLASASQRHYLVQSSTTPADMPLTHMKSKPPPPEKSWKLSAPLPQKFGKLYSSQDHPVKATISGLEMQKSTPSRSERQSTSSKATDRGISATSSYNSSLPVQATGSDFRRELGDHSYISLSLAQPVQTEDQRRRIAVVTQENDEPDGFTYGWTTHDQKKRKRAPQQPGSYQLRHSRWPVITTEDYETAATAF